jgi:putative hydrolase of the HAD superfamily
MRQVISFDLDGTLIKPDFNYLIWYEIIPKLYAKKQGIKLEEAKKLVKKEYDTVGENDLRWYRLDYWLEHLKLNKSQEEILGKYIDKIILYPDVLPSLNHLKGRYKLVIASGMSEDFILIKLKKNNLSRFFSHIFSAVSLGLIKKEESFYLAMCRSLDIKPADLAHVGDHYEVDYLVPRKIGIEAYLLDRENQREKDFGTVNNLEEFINYLISRESISS